MDTENNQNNTEKQLKKIIRLILQYHGSLKTVCIFCNHQLKLGTNVKTSWKPDKITEDNLINKVLSDKQQVARTILYCSCDKCGDFWVVSHCEGEHHRLLKFKESFHKKSQTNSNKWLYDCPVCGNSLVSEEN